jgi:hypothetical protein
VLAIVAGLANTVALFGDSPHLSFPLAWTDRVGYPVGTSIALLDAIPLVAILLRPLSPILPVPFQYLGLYSPRRSWPPVVSSTSNSACAIQTRRCTWAPGRRPASSDSSSAR